MGKRFGNVQREVQICTGATCDVCGVELEAAISSRDGEYCTLDGALYLTASGPGYGEFMDGDPSIKGVLCVKCAREFLEKYPFMRTPPEPEWVPPVEPGCCERCGGPLDPGQWGGGLCCGCGMAPCFDQ